MMAIFSNSLTNLQNTGFYVVIDQSFSKVIFDHDKWSNRVFTIRIE